MIKSILIETAILSIPFVIVTARKRFPHNQVLPYFIPRYLADRPYPKTELRQAGSGCFAFAAWLFLLVLATTSLFLPNLKQSPLLLAVFFFALPMAFGMSLLTGILYLGKGLLGKNDSVKSPLESLDEAQKELLPHYIRKIKIYNTINLSCPFLIIVSILTEESLGFAESGWAVLWNVSLLITFILTLWRIRIYLVKTAKAMDLSANTILSSTLSNPLAIFFVWIHSFLLIKKFHHQNRGNASL